MYKEIKQDVWNLLNENSTICVLTNNSLYVMYDASSMSEIYYNPMGGGIAYEAKLRNPHLDILSAESMIEGRYIICKDSISKADIFRFPTLHHIGEKADLILIENSLHKLKEYINNNKDKIIYLPRPGCGIGGLDWEKDIKPLCDKILKNMENIYIVSK